MADLSDIHIGNLYHNKKEFNRFLDLIQDTENFYVIIGGDSTENATVTSASSIFEEGIHGMDQIIKLRDKLLPIKDRILFCRSGNHGYERALRHNKLVPEMVLAESLRVPFFHGCGTVFFNVKKNCYVISTWHNSKATKNMEWLQSDITFYEHLHKNTYEVVYTAEPNKYAKKWIVRPRYHIQSGSFLGWGGYTADKGYRPVGCGTTIVGLSGKKDKWNVQLYQDLDMFKRVTNEN